MVSFEETSHDHGWRVCCRHCSMLEEVTQWTSWAVHIEVIAECFVRPGNYSRVEDIMMSIL